MRLPRTVSRPAAAMLAIFHLTVPCGRGEVSPEAVPVANSEAASVPGAAKKLVLTNVMPGWLAGIDGTIGVGGIDTAVDVGFDEISKNLDMIGAASLEGRYGKFGFILEGIYLKASVGGETPGPLLSNVSVSVEQVIAEAALTYRFFESDRAWIEFLAGARYLYMGNELTLSVDPAGVQSVSESLSGAIVDRAAAAARAAVAKRLPGIRAEIESEIAELRERAIDALDGIVFPTPRAYEEALKEHIDLNLGLERPRLDETVAEFQTRIDSRVRDISGIVREEIDRGIGSTQTQIGEEIAEAGPIQEVIREYAKARVESEIEAARARISAAVASARARIRKEVDRRLEQAEKKLAKAIAREITEHIPDSPVAASKGWVDPFVGFRGRCQLWEAWFLTARGDIGGFGVSSDLVWNLYAALGLDLTERTSLELGYRYLSVDYQSGAFSIDAAMKGPYVGVRIEF